MLYKTFYFMCCACLMTITLNAQHVSIQAGGGYKMYKYDKLDNYKSASSIPYYIRASLALGPLEIGGEYFGDVSPLTYYFEDPNISQERFKEKHQQTYYGGFIGVNSTKPNKSGIFLRVGAGMNTLTKNFVLEDGQNYLTQKLNATLEAKGSVGGSIRLTKGLFLDIEGMYGTVFKRNKADFAADQRVKDPKTFLIASYGGLMGLSYHF